MTRNQFWALNIIGSLLAALILLNMSLGILNRDLSKKIKREQENLASVPTFEKVTQNLILRLASASRHDKAIKALLAKHHLEIRFNDKKK